MNGQLRQPSIYHKKETIEHGSAMLLVFYIMEQGWIHQ